MARRSDHTREELRELILDAASALVEAEGAGALSTRKIASRIGYTSGTLYQHFKDITDILIGVNARTMARLAHTLEEDQSNFPTEPVQRLHAFADIYVAFVTDNANAWGAMFYWRRNPGDSMPDWYVDRIDALVDKVAACFEALEPGPGATSPAQAARLLWASVHSVCALDSGGRRDLTMRSDLSTLIHQLVNIHITAYCTGSVGAQ